VLRPTSTIYQYVIKKNSTYLRRNSWNTSFMSDWNVDEHLSS
jgi:hypothetical protein